jgi:hypothetical protein
VVVMAGEVFGQLEATMIVGAVDPPGRAGIDEGGDVAIGAALGQAGVGLEDLGNREGRPAPAMVSTRARRNRV